MSYFSWADQGLKYGASPDKLKYDWGTSADGFERTAAHSVMQADIMAIQALYGASRQTPFSTPQVFGFGSTITGPLAAIYDFALNTRPIVTLYSTALGNTLDLSGFSGSQTIDLGSGSVSSVGDHGKKIS